MEGTGRWLTAGRCSCRSSILAGVSTGSSPKRWSLVFKSPFSKACIALSLSLLASFKRITESSSLTRSVSSCRFQESGCSPRTHYGASAKWKALSRLEPRKVGESDLPLWGCVLVPDLKSLCPWMYIPSHPRIALGPRHGFNHLFVHFFFFSCLSLFHSHQGGHPETKLQWNRFAKRERGSTRQVLFQDGLPVLQNPKTRSFEMGRRPPVSPFCVADDLPPRTACSRLPDSEVVSSTRSFTWDKVFVSSSRTCL